MRGSGGSPPAVASQNVVAPRMKWFWGNLFYRGEKALGSYCKKAIRWSQIRPGCAYRPAKLRKGWRSEILGVVAVSFGSDDQHTYQIGPHFAFAFGPGAFHSLGQQREAHELIERLDEEGTVLWQ